MSKCKLCGAEIVWINTLSGKKMPCDVDLITVVTESGMTVRGRKPHWVTCPNADEFKKYCIDGTKDILPQFKTLSGVKAAITATNDFIKDIDEQPTIDGELMKWKPLTVREATEEERKEKGWLWAYEGELPEYGEQVIVSNILGYVFQTGWIYDRLIKYDLAGITYPVAWMPLPKPYKGVKNETN